MRASFYHDSLEAIHRLLLDHDITRGCLSCAGVRLDGEVVHPDSRIKFALPDGSWLTGLEFAHLFSELDGIIAVVDVLGAADLGTLSCRMRVELNDGAVLAGELRNGGNELALDRSTIDEWCAQLWAGAGRTPDAYVRTRDAVARLAAGSFADLRATLLLAG